MNVLKPLNLEAGMQVANLPNENLSQYDNNKNYVFGDRVINNNTNNIYQMIRDESKGAAPEQGQQSNSTWQYLGRSNSRRIIDGIVGSESKFNKSEGSVTFFPQNIFNALTVFNTSSSEINLLIESNESGQWETVYKQDFTMSDPGSPIDYFEWFFTEPGRRGELVVNNIPPYSKNSRITLSFKETTGLMPTVGLVCIGFLKFVGWSQFGSTVGIQDYSRKETDEFGNAIIQQRKSVRRANFDVKIQTEKVADVQNYFNENRATPLVFIGAEKYESTIIYGFFREFDVVLADPAFSDASIDITGL